MGERPSIAPETLYPRRLAAWALRAVLGQYALAEMSLKLSPDDPTQCLPGAGPGEVEFYEDYQGGRGAVLATVILDGARARVLVERVERLIRLNHRRGVVAREVGIVRRPGAPDIDAVLDLQEVIESEEGRRMRTAPQRRPLPPEYRRRPGSAVRAFGSSR